MRINITLAEIQLSDHPDRNRFTRLCGWGGGGHAHPRLGANVLTGGDGP